MTLSMNMENTSIDNKTQKTKQYRDGYRKTSRGAGGVLTMKLTMSKGMKSVRVHTIPDVDDQLFLLTSKGMMIRVRAIKPKRHLEKPQKEPGSWNCETRTKVVSSMKLSSPLVFHRFG